MRSIPRISAARPRQKRPINAQPFGNGQRPCIGRGFAMHEAALAIGRIPQRFKLIDVHRHQSI
jgi:cytochrome P450/NADPH-cytochrome P450 reductase